MMMETKTTNNAENFHDYLKKTKGISDRTIYNYLSTYYRPFVNQDLTQKNIDRFIQSKKNCSMVRGFMKSYIEFLKMDKEFDLPERKTGTSQKKIIRPISDQEIKTIRKYCYNNKVREGIMFDLLYYGALRRTEILTINTNSFDWNGWFNDPDGFCSFRVLGKGKKERNILVHPDAVKHILDAYLEKGLINNHMNKDEIITKLNSIDDPLFKMGEYNIWRIIKRNSQHSLGKDVRPHEIRHARATELLDKGASVRDIQQYLGHSNVGTTEIYLHTKEKVSLNRIKNLSQEL